MKCRACGARYAANQRSSAPGGFSSPGVFFVIGLVAVAATVWVAVGGAWMWAVPLGLVALITVGAALTSWGDANVHVGPDGRGLPGARCPRCRHVQPVRPWSL